MVNPFLLEFTHMRISLRVPNEWRQTAHKLLLGGRKLLIFLALHALPFSKGCLKLKCTLACIAHNSLLMTFARTYNYCIVLATYAKSSPISAVGGG